MGTESSGKDYLFLLILNTWGIEVEFSMHRKATEKMLSVHRHFVIIVKKWGGIREHHIYQMSSKTISEVLIKIRIYLSRCLKS